MPVVVGAKTSHKGFIKPSDYNVEVVLFEVKGETNDYMVEGYVDVRELEEGDSIKICELIAVDGVVESPFLCVEITGSLSEPVLRFHTKTLLSSMIYKVILTQLYGYLRWFYYGFIKQTLQTV